MLLTFSGACAIRPNFRKIQLQFPFRQVVVLFVQFHVQGCGLQDPRRL